MVGRSRFGTTGRATSQPRRRTKRGGGAADVSRTDVSSIESSSAVPARNPRRCRTAAGITTRPALSMVVVIPLQYHLYGTSSRASSTHSGFGAPEPGPRTGGRVFVPTALPSASSGSPRACGRGATSSGSPEQGRGTQDRRPGERPRGRTLLLARLVVAVSIIIGLVAARFIAPPHPFRRNVMAEACRPVVTW